MDWNQKMTRREFITTLAGVAFISLGSYPTWKKWFLPTAHITLPEVRPTKPTGHTVSLTFHIEAGKVQLGDGRNFQGYLINQQFPGPEIRVRQGDKVNITVQNGLTQPTTLHWHGVNVSSPMDGVPGISHSPIMPGQSFTYSFIAGPSGSRWYHAHVFEMDQVPNGLFGPLIIEDTTLQTENTRETLLLSTWGYKSNPGLDYGMQSGTSNGQMASSSPGLIYLVNGKLPGQLHLGLNRPKNPPWVRIINGSATESFNFTIDGGHMTVTHADGNPLPREVDVRTLYIAPAERYDVILSGPQSGVAKLKSNIAGQSLEVPFQTSGSAKTSSNPIQDSWHYAYGGTTYEGLPAVDKTYNLNLSGGMMMGPNWTINGKSYPNTAPLRVNRGEKVRIQMQNHSMMEHPMHLHGHTFDITSFNGQTLQHPIAKDVVNLRPMETCTIDFVADNPGNWFFHCHNLQHMRGGLATVVEYVDYPLPYVDKWM